MPVINGIKFACAPCMRGHRSSKCTHSDRVLVKVRKPGRPLSACPHATGPDAFVHSSPGSIEKGNVNGVTKQAGKCPTGECGCNSSVTSVAIPNVASCACGSSEHKKPPEKESTKEQEGTNNVDKTNGCYGGHSASSPPLTPAHKVTKRGSVGTKKHKCVFYEGKKGELAEKFLSELESQTNENDRKASATTKQFDQLHDEHESKGTGVEYTVVGNGTRNALTNGHTAHHHDLFPSVESQLGFDGTFNTDIFNQPAAPQQNGGSCCSYGGHTSNSQPMGPPPTSPTTSQHNDASGSNLHSTPLSSPFAVPLSPSFFPDANHFPFTSAPDIMHQLPTSWSYNTNQTPTPTPQAQTQTITATLTPQEMAWLLKARASGFFTALNQSSTPQPAATAIATPQPRLRPSGNCVCGDACTCIGCADHPYNPRMLGYVKELSQMTQQSSQSQGGAGSTPLATTPTVNFNVPSQNVQGGSCCGGGGGGANGSAGTTPRFTETEASSPDATDVTMSPSDYMIVDYALGNCSSVENGCMCGDGCMCLGCLTHSGHDEGAVGM